MNQLFFHLIFVFVLLAFTVTRAAYQKRAINTRGKVEYKEGRILSIFRSSIGIPFMLAVLAYIFRESLMAWSEVDLPAWLQWVGVVMGLASLPLIMWVHRALGANFSTTLHVRETHTLFTSGPYRWIRHPM